MIDLGKFLTILLIFEFGFTVMVVGMNQPYYEELANSDESGTRCFVDDSGGAAAVVLPKILLPLLLVLLLLLRYRFCRRPSVLLYGAPHCTYSSIYYRQ